MKKFAVLLSSVLIAGNIAYADELDLSREALENATGLSLSYNASW